MTEKQKVLVFVLSFFAIGIVNGIAMGIFANDVGTGIISTIISMVALMAVLTLGDTLIFMGSPRSIDSLNFNGQITYKVLPFFRGDNQERFEMLRIGEESNIFENRYYAIDFKQIRGGAEAIPRDGTPFKLVRGVDDNDIVVIKVPVPVENEFVPVKKRAPAD